MANDTPRHGPPPAAARPAGLPDLPDEHGLDVAGGLAVLVGVDGIRTGSPVDPDLVPGHQLSADQRAAAYKQAGNAVHAPTARHAVAAAARPTGRQGTLFG